MSDYNEFEENSPNDGEREVDFEGDPDSVYSGTSMTIPTFVEWKMSAVYSAQKNIVDYSTMGEFDTAFNKARIGLQTLTDKINEYDRLAREAKTGYERKFRREFLGSVEKTEAMKRARAALKCEELENEWIVKDQLVNELVRASHTMRQELQALTTVANNLRQQLKL